MDKKKAWKELGLILWFTLIGFYTGWNAQSLWIRAHALNSGDVYLDAMTFCHNPLFMGH